MIEFELKRVPVLFCFFTFLVGISMVQVSRGTERSQGESQTASVDSKPILKRAVPMALGLDPTPGSSLNLTIEGEYKDLLGLRIKEQFVDANGTTFTLEEDYPVWIDSSYVPTRRGLGGSVGVYFRQRKDDERWRKYLEDVQMRRELEAKNKAAEKAGEPVIDIQAEKMEMPPVWMSIPQPGKVRVFVSVYDKAGNESDIVEVKQALDWFAFGEDINKSSKKSVDYYLADDLRFGTSPTDLATDLGNAALLYYQAALRRPIPDTVTSMSISSVLRGDEPDRHIRPYLKRCRDTIRLSHAASLIPQCNWGVSSSHEVGYVPFVHLKNLCYVLSLYAHTLAVDGHYRAALESSLTIRRLAFHTGETGIVAYIAARSIDNMAMRTIQYVLALMPPDVDMLAWFRAQLAVVQGAPKSSSIALMNSFESIQHNLQINRELLTNLRNLFTEDHKNVRGEEERERPTDKELIIGACRPYSQYLNSVLYIMNSGLLYEQKYDEIQRLEMKLVERQALQPMAKYISLFGGGLTAKFFAFGVQDASYYNALKVATEIYLVRAKTGQLPTTLPDGLPKDPFSGKDFEYETTDDGFMLRCRARDIEASPKEIRPGQPPKIISDKFQQYEFKIKN